MLTRKLSTYGLIFSVCVLLGFPVLGGGLGATSLYIIKNKGNLDTSLLKDIIIGISAFVGMLLGIYNLIRAIKKEKVKLKIIPKTVMSETRNIETGGIGFILTDNDFSNKHTLFAFEIINKSDFSVVVDEIGFKIKGNKNRLVIFAPQLGDKGEWPRELLPRKSVIVYGKLENILEAFKMNTISTAYVKTNCDDIFYGNSIALKLLKRYANKNV